MINIKTMQKGHMPEGNNLYSLNHTVTTSPHRSFACISAGSLIDLQYNTGLTIKIQYDQASGGGQQAF